MEDNDMRYARHYSLKDFGIESQQKLTGAKVLVIGAGGLGCPALQYLAAAGVGTIGIADDDHVSLSNLQRQVLYTTDDIGKSKATVAALKLKSLNPEISIISYDTAITTANALEVIEKYAIVVDCTDNFTARYLINDACTLLDKPLVFGAIFQYEGQAGVFNVAGVDGKKTNYRNLFPEPPRPGEVADCNEAGVLGVLPGMIGVIQATEVIKLITGIGEVLANKLFTISLLTYDSMVVEIGTNQEANSLLPENTAAFKAMDYALLCGASVAGIEALSAGRFVIKAALPDTIIIDVREADELPKTTLPHRNIPLSHLASSMDTITQNNILLFCQSGKRSLAAAEILLERYGTSKKISHLKGGIIALQENYEQGY
jgi:molybdopterin/thiamine biosynthesis adenylyltransferase/rhodanese-related sulfurtransferase